MRNPGRVPLQPLHYPHSCLPQLLDEFFAPLPAVLSYSLLSPTPTIPPTTRGHFKSIAIGADGRCISALSSAAVKMTAEVQKLLLKEWAKDTDHLVDDNNSPKAEFARLAKAKGWTGGDTEWCYHWKACFDETYTWGVRRKFSSLRLMRL